MWALPLLLLLLAAASVLAELGCIFILKEKEKHSVGNRFQLKCRVARLKLLARFAETQEHSATSHSGTPQMMLPGAIGSSRLHLVS